MRYLTSFAPMITLYSVKYINSLCANVFKASRQYSSLSGDDKTTGGNMTQPISNKEGKGHEYQYSLSYKKYKDFSERFLKDGFTLTRMSDNGKYYDVFVRESIQVIDGVKKRIKEIYPVVEKDVDLYVTGYYKEKSGKHKGRVNKIELRVPIRIVFALNPAYVDDFKNELKEKAEKAFEDWLLTQAIQWGDIPDIDRVDTDFRDGIE
jgi:hypothetical protein